MNTNPFKVYSRKNIQSVGTARGAIHRHPVTNPLGPAPLVAEPLEERPMPYLSNQDPEAPALRSVRSQHRVPVFMATSPARPNKRAQDTGPRLGVSKHNLSQFYSLQVRLYHDRNGL